MLATDSRVPPAIVIANVVRNRARLVVSLVGVSFSVFLIVFQASLLIGFVRASQQVIRSVDGSVWIAPRGISCFDFAARVPARFADVARQTPGIGRVIELAAGFTTLVRTDGARRAVLVVGAERGAGDHFPLAGPASATAPPDGVVIDRSNADLLGVDRLPQAVEVAERRAIVVRQIDGFGSFLGSPYVFARYLDAREMLGMRGDETSYIVVKASPGADPNVLATALQRRFPETDVLTADDFAQRSSIFWLVQTGAGGAILVAAMFGFVIGLTITSQTMYANTMEHVSEFATLKAIGASNATLVRIVLYQAAIVAVAGASIGLLLTWPLVHLARRFLVAWILLPPSIVMAAPPVALFMCGLGAVASIRRVLRVDPVVVLRR